MIQKISSGKSFYGLIEYNESKVRVGEAELLELHYIPEGSTLQETLEFVAGQNPACKKNTFHVSLSFPPDEHPSDEIMLDIAHDFMEGMGYGEQPYGIYRHHDTDNDHIHIVSTRIDWQGKRIDDAYEKIKSNRLAAELEKKYGLKQVNHGEKNKIQPTVIYEKTKIDTTIDKDNPKKHITNVIGTILAENNVTDMQNYTRLLSKYNVGIRQTELEGINYFLIDDKGNQTTPNIPASNISFKPTYKRLQQIFKKGTDKKIEIQKRLRPKFRWINDYEALSKESFEKFLIKNNLQIDYVSNAGGIYGVNFYDTKNKIFIKGSEIGCSWNMFKNKLNDTISFKIGEERNCVERIYNKLQRNSNFYNESSFIENKDIEQLLTDEINKSNNEQLIKKLEPFIKDIATQKEQKLDSIKTKEKERYNKKAEMVRSYMSLTTDIGATIIAYSFGYQIKENQLINEKENISIPVDIHNFKIPYKKLIEIPKDVKKAVKDIINALDQEKKELIPECLAFAPTDNFGAAIIHKTMLNADLLSLIAKQNYMQNNYGRLTKKTESKQELIGELLYRGIRLNKINNNNVELEFDNQTIIVEDKELADTLTNLNTAKLNSYANIDMKKLSEINRKEVIGEKSELQPTPISDNYENWIKDNFETFRTFKIKDAGEETTITKEPKPNDNDYKHYNTADIILGSLSHLRGSIFQSLLAMSGSQSKGTINTDLTEEELKELIKQLRGKLIK